MTTPTQSDEELSKKAILWVKANAPDLDMCCYAQEVTETEDGDLCINCRHIFWAAVRGYIAGQQELEAVKRDSEFLSHLSTRLKTQDNRCTSDVMFIVQQKERIWNVEPECHDSFCAYICDDVVIYEDDKQFKTLKKLEDKGKKLGDWRKAYYSERWEFVTACFTEEGALNYVKCNGHNLNSPRIYGWSGYRNKEWCDIREFLLNYEQFKQAEGGE